MPSGALIIELNNMGFTRDLVLKERVLESLMRKGGVWRIAGRITLLTE